MDTRKERKTSADDIYYDIDLSDSIEDATARLYKPKKKSIYQFFSNYFNCFSRTKSNDTLPDVDLSCAEPMTPIYDKSPDK